ncbi:DNA repair protein RadC [bacterium]|nr:DNA repair protein RadC [bacterium]
MSSSWFDGQQGDTAVVVGGGDGLARYIRTRFKRVVAADPARSLGEPPRTRTLQEGEILFVQGIDAQPDHLPGGCDLVVLAFTLARQDDAASFLTPWVKLLNHQGRLVIVEWSPNAGRFGQEQKLHRELLDSLASGGRLRPPASRDVVHWMQGCGLAHVRQLTESDPAFFSDSDSRLLAAEGLSELLALGLADSELGTRLREQRRIHPGPVLIVHGVHKALPEPVANEQLADSENGPGLIVSPVAETEPELDNDAPLSDLLAGVLDGEVEQPKPVAKRLLRMFGGKALTQIRDASLLAREGGLTIDAAERLIRIFALGRRLYSTSNDVEIHGPEDAYQFLAPQMAQLTREHFRGLYLNVKGGLVVDEVISIGTLTSALVHPREVFGPAIEKHCHSVLIAHNHPSGDPAPSPEDIHLTRELAEAGRLLNIELLDHIIIGRDTYVSLKERRHF